MIRLFVSLKLPDEVRECLHLVCCDVPGARWVDPDQLHLTVRFIGEVEEPVFEEIRDGLGSVHVAPFELEFRGVGHFPPRGQPRVLWAGTGQSEELVLLRQRVDSVLVRVGLPPEARKFAPHITLARLRGTPSRAVGSFLSTNGLFRAGPIVVDRFWLYSSRLSPKRSVHLAEAEYLLGDALV